jgi:hypothetical protein
MTTYMILWCAAMYILGQLFHLFVQKIPAMKSRAKAANYEFTLKDYWREEWFMICGALCLGIMLIIGASEIVQWKPQVADWMRWFFGFVGYFFNSLIVGKLGQYEKKLSKIIDAKTNFADSLNETNEKGKPLNMEGDAPGEKTK